jgi:hypothetical protein
MSSSTAFTATLIFWLVMEIFAPVNSNINHKLYYGEAKEMTSYAANDISNTKHGSFLQLFKQEEGSNVAQNDPKSATSKGHRKNYIDVSYYLGREAFKAPIVNISSAKHDVNEGSEFSDASTEEFTTQKLPLDISVDRIIDTPRRKCPSGQKMDPFGMCKAVWES